MKAGPNDYMEVVLSGVTSSGVTYGVGTSYSTASGGKLSEPD